MILRLTLAVCGALAGLVAAAPSFAASHYECQIHGFRPYSHRHIDPGDKTVACDRQQQQGQYPTAARCVAHGLRNGGAGPVALGTQMSMEVPYPPDAPTYIRVESMNAACEDAAVACMQAASGMAGDIQCEVVDQNFTR